MSYAEGLTGLNKEGLKKMAQLRDKLMDAVREGDEAEADKIKGQMEDVANDPSYKN